MYFAPTEVVYNHKVLKEQLKVHKALTCIKFFTPLCAFFVRFVVKLKILCALCVYFVRFVVKSEILCALCAYFVNFVVESLTKHFAV